MSEGTVLVGETWMCPACANSVAATRGLRVAETLDDVLGENRTEAEVELAEAESAVAGLPPTRRMTFEEYAHEHELAEAEETTAVCLKCGKSFTAQYRNPLWCRTCAKAEKGVK
jgi:ribosomal protein S27AE